MVQFTTINPISDVLYPQVRIGVRQVIVKSNKLVLSLKICECNQTLKDQKPFKRNDLITILFIIISLNTTT